VLLRGARAAVAGRKLCERSVPRSFERLRASGRSVARPRRRHLHQLAEGRGEGEHVVGRHEAARHPVLDEIHGAARRDCNDRQARGGAFEKHCPNVSVVLAKQKTSAAA
jgi:hypothetical protein